MINEKQAQLIAQEFIMQIESKSFYKLALLPDNTIEFDLGWFFFYQSKEFVDTQNIMYALGGNAPIIVNRFDGSVEITGTGEPIQFYIDQYVKRKKDATDADS